MPQPQPFHPAMIHAVRQTLENMVFMEVMEQSSPAGDIPDHELAWSSLVINDPVQGEVRLAMPMNLLQKITAHIFGMDEENVTPAQRDDILNELLNTIVGLFMTSLLPDEQEYKIGLPCPGQGALPEVDADTVVWHLVTSDDDPVKLYAAGESLVALHSDGNRT